MATYTLDGATLAGNARRIHITHNGSPDSLGWVSITADQYDNYGMLSARTTLEVKGADLLFALAEVGLIDPVEGIGL